MGLPFKIMKIKLIFTASTHCIQGSILKLLSILLWSARLYFNENMCHLSKWCSYFCSSLSQMWCQDKGLSADSHAMPWHMTRVANLLHKTSAKSLPESQLFLGQNSALLLTEFLQSLDHGRRCPWCQTSGLEHCVILPLTQVSYRIFSWNKSLKVPQGELSAKCLKCNCFLKLC